MFVLDPRLAGDTAPIGDLPLSRVLLMNDARFPWLILVPRQAGLRDLTDLTRDDQHALRALARPDKLNIASLGNVVAQLHVHVIARLTTDAAWPRPVWTHGDREAYADAELRARCSALRTALHIDREA